MTDVEKSGDGSEQPRRATPGQHEKSEAGDAFHRLHRPPRQRDCRPAFSRAALFPAAVRRRRSARSVPAVVRQTAAIPARKNAAAARPPRPVRIRRGGAVFR